MYLTAPTHDYRSELTILANRSISLDTATHMHSCTVTTQWLWSWLPPKRVQILMPLIAHPSWKFCHPSLRQPLGSFLHAPLPDILRKKALGLLSNAWPYLISAQCDRSPISTSLSSPKKLQRKGTLKVGGVMCFSFLELCLWERSQLYRWQLSYSFTLGLQRLVIDILISGCELAHASRNKLRW